MQRIDRAIGVALALLAAMVLWTARGFPAVPGQKLGAGFLPLLVGSGLLVGGIALVLRSTNAARYREGAGVVVDTQRHGAAVILLGAVLGYVLLADRLGFLIVAPFVLLAAFKALAVGWRAAALWAIAGSAVVHVAFYKLLRVPLPWGVLRPFY